MSPAERAALIALRLVVRENVDAVVIIDALLSAPDDVPQADMTAVSRAARNMRRYRARRGVTSAQWLTIRACVIQRDGYVCGICQLPVDPSDVHIDHIVPLSKGGRTMGENLRVTHSICNARKSGRHAVTSYTDQIRGRH